VKIATLIEVIAKELFWAGKGSESGENFRANKVGGEKHLDDLEQVQGSQNSAQLTHTT